MPPLLRDFKAEPECGPVAAARLVNAGFRVVPISTSHKGATRKGFGKEFPNYCCPPEDFRPDELVAVLMGPCPLGTFAATSSGPRWLMGFDLDGTGTRAMLEARLGPLPPTLTSKGERHLYYWLTPDLPGRDGIRQGNDIFRTKAKQGWALDWRPCAGGYFLERGDWDGRFDHTNVADLPSGAWEKLLGARKAAKPAPACVVPAQYARDERAPRPALLESIADDLAMVWPPPGGGGGHDLALALGGVLADAWISEDDAIDFAMRIWEGAAAPAQVGEVLTSMRKRRSGDPTPVFGWPKLRAILTEHNGSELTDRALAGFANRMPGLKAPKCCLYPRAKPSKDD